MLQVIWYGNKTGAVAAVIIFATMIHDPVLNEYYLAGDSESGDGDFTESLGETDFAIIKLKIPELLSKDSAVCSINGFIPVQDTLRDACGYDSVYGQLLTRYLSSGPFSDSRKADTIFVGQSIQTIFKW